MFLACEDGVYRIAEAFGNSLEAFRFPPSIANVLSGIVGAREEQEMEEERYREQEERETEEDKSRDKEMAEVR